MVRNVKKFILFDSEQWRVDNGEWTIDSGQWTMESGKKLYEKH